MQILWLASRSLPLLLGIRIGLRIASPATVRHVLARWLPAAACTRRPFAQSLEQVRCAMALTDRLVPAGSCLPRALAAQVLLARMGHATRLGIGAARAAKGAPVRCHAWLEHDRKVILGGADARAHFEPIPISFIRSSARKRGMQ